MLIKSYDKNISEKSFLINIERSYNKFETKPPSTSNFL